MIKKLLVLIIGALLLTGCGTNIRQEGNKIYTDLTKERVYDFAVAAVQNRGYSVTQEDKKNFTFTAVPNNNNTTLGRVDTDNKSVQAAITDGRNNETVVTILALANGRIDQEASERLAREAVAEIITELNKYGKFTSQKTAEHTYAIATPERVFDFIEDYLVLEGLAYDSVSNGFNARETRPNNQFNEPLAARIVVDADATNRVIVRVGAVLQGNYDVQGNQVYVDSFVTRFIDYLDSYPVVERGVRHTYRHIDFARAFANARAAITDLGYTVTNADNRNFVLAATKDNLNLAVTFTRINTSIAVNVEAFVEADAGETKAELSEQVTAALAEVSSQLALYQTTLTSEKTFLSSNQNDVVRAIRQALDSIGYSHSFNSSELAFDAVDRTNANRAHHLLVNNMGSNGISVQITTLFNTRSATAEATVRAENNRLLRALGNFDNLK